MDNVPISVYIEDTKSKIVECINSLKVHPYILEPILKEIYEDTVSLKTKMYCEELIKYSQSKEENKNG